MYAAQHVCSPASLVYSFTSEAMSTAPSDATSTHAPTPNTEVAPTDDTEATPTPNTEATSTQTTEAAPKDDTVTTAEMMVKALTAMEVEVDAMGTATEGAAREDVDTMEIC